MNAGDPGFRRLLVALDASGHSMAALEAAATLAARAGAELVGLFVEDEEVLRLGDLPGARVVEPGLRTTRVPQVDEMRRALQAHAERARRALAEVAERAHVRWSFQVAHGRVAPELLSASLTVDLVCIGCAGLAPVRRSGLGSTARALLQGSSGVLLIREGETLRPPVVVLHAGTPASDRALQVAGEVAGRVPKEIPAEAVRRARPDLIVLLAPEDPQQADSLLDRVRILLAGKGHAARTRRLEGRSVDALLAAARAERGRTLVLPADAAPRFGDDWEGVVRRFGAPVLVVR